MAAPAQILSLVLTEEIELCLDTRIILEYQEVLHRPKFEFDNISVNSIVRYFEKSAEFVTATAWKLSLPDKDDAMFLEVARAANAEYLVTGNLKHLPKRARGNVEVVTPVQFIDRRGF